MWPGRTADVTAFLPVVDRLRQRFFIGRVCVVADRGMISAATIEGLEVRKLEYILGARERSDAIVRKIVLENDAPFVPLLLERKAGETQLFVKQVMIEGKRYIVCRNEAEAEKDRKDREAIIAALDAQLKKGDKALIGNSAYRRYLRKRAGTKDKTKGKDKDEGDRAFEIDAGKLAEEARFDRNFRAAHQRQRDTPCRPCFAIAICFRSKICSCGPRRSCARGRFSIRPMRPSALMCSVRSWRSPCKNISTISSSRRASRRNGRNCCAISIGLQQVRLQYRGADWLVRTDAAPTITAFSARPCRAAAASPKTAPPKPRPPETRAKTPRPPQA